MRKRIFGIALALSLVLGFGVAVCASVDYTPETEYETVISIQPPEDCTWQLPQLRRFCDWNPPDP